MLIVSRQTIRLSVDIQFNYSRPSIDLTFFSAAEIYGCSLLAIIFSGANRDGAYGMREVKLRGGKTIIQHPDECEVKTMPEAVKNITEVDAMLHLNEIILTLNNFCT